MVTKAASNFRDAAMSAAQTVHKNVCEFRMSTRTLGTISHILNTGAAVVAWSHNPQATLAGAIVGGGLRRILGDNRSSDPISDEDLRANRTARICFTSVAACYTVATCSANSCSPDCSNVIPFVLGVQGIADGAYLLMRKALS